MKENEKFMTNTEAFHMIEDSLLTLKRFLTDQKKKISYKVEWDVGEKDNKPYIDISYDV